MPDSATHWNALHANPRFRPVYPNEDVVRFLMALRSQVPAHTHNRLLDIGSGSGRHMGLAAQLGFFRIRHRYFFHWPFSCSTAHGMNRFDRSGSGGLYDQSSVRRSVLSCGRGLRFFLLRLGRGNAASYRRNPSCVGTRRKSFVVLRSTDDYRHRKGREPEPNTFELDISETNELGTIQHFVAAEDIPEYFSLFANVSFEKSDWTTCNRTRLNSDWLITAEK